MTSTASTESSVAVERTDRASAAASASTGTSTKATTSSPAASAASAASVAGPRKVPTIATRRPFGNGWEANTVATSNNWSSESTRVTPVLRSTASATTAGGASAAA